VRVWVDIENPPQVQYLTPLASAFADAGADVVVTARDYGATYDLLEARGIPFRRVGSSYGKEKWRKATGLATRTGALVRTVGGRRPDVVVHAGRAPALAASVLRIPSFCFLDYEFVDVAVARVTRSFVVHPRVIPASAFTRRGVREDRLLDYDGLKEHLTFAGTDLAAVEPLELEGSADGCSRILVRPPAEESHYYRSESGSVARALVAYLAEQDGVQVVFSPRSADQASYLDDLSWQVQPIVVAGSTPFLPLLYSVDAVVASGGTMAREAAYLGIPSYSIFQGDVGAVDRHLESLGRLEFLASSEDFARLRLEPKPEPVALTARTSVPDQVVDDVSRRAGLRSRDGAATLA
jgi:uncharacterized protein